MSAEWTRRKGRLGKKMAALRERVPGKLTQAVVAKRLKISEPTISRLEAGKSRPPWPTIASLLMAYQASPEDEAEVSRLWEAARQKPITIEHGKGLSPSYLAFRRDEFDADGEKAFNVGAITGLLQTPGYADALRSAAPTNIQGDEQAQRAADERRSRQQLLEGDNPLHLHVIMGEALLRQLVGGREVMIEQLEHLLTTGQRDHVTIQVVPFERGAWATSPAVLLYFPDDEPPMAYLEHAGGGETVEESHDVQGLADTFDYVAEHTALPEDASADLIGSVLNELRMDEQQPN
ncbi:helix-turn-helix domain-containing protein [Amycolatopsis sp. NPDC059021]|uniref:helix-turn-helix domain-containing protein n=1 Tax=Amycolatopsis sp. NPDC059021 TaxID=3346704 RepID=UPI0036719850